MNDQSPFSSQAGSPIQVNVVRMALFGGPLLFGLVTWYLTRTEGAFGSADNVRPMIYVFIPLVVLAAAAVVVLRGRQSRAADLRGRFTFGLVGWALCESTALFGGVYFLLSGDPALYLIGMTLLAVSMVYLSPSRATM